MKMHTPTPWMEHGGDIWDVLPNDEPGIPLLRGAYDHHRSWGRKLTNAERAANAEFIIRAVNAHDRLKAIIDEQAADGGLWFIPQSAAEAYLMQELRKLHAAFEGVSPDECARAAIARAEGE